MNTQDYNNRYSTHTTTTATPLNNNINSNNNLYLILLQQYLQSFIPIIHPTSPAPTVTPNAASLLFQSPSHLLNHLPFHHQHQQQLLQSTAQTYSLGYLMIQVSNHLLFYQIPVCFVTVILYFPDRFLWIFG